MTNDPPPIPLAYDTPAPRAEAGSGVVLALRLLVPVTMLVVVGDAVWRIWAEARPSSSAAGMWMGGMALIVIASLVMAVLGIIASRFAVLVPAAMHMMLCAVYIVMIVTGHASSILWAGLAYLAFAIPVNLVTLARLSAPRHA